jgi:hypothetical protein
MKGQEVPTRRMMFGLAGINSVQQNVELKCKFNRNGELGVQNG